MIKKTVSTLAFYLCLVSASVLVSSTAVEAQKPAEPAQTEADIKSQTEALLKFPLGGMEIVTPNETHSFLVELALDPARQAQGLMFREELSDDHGMLFMFANEQMRSFWMRNTLIPLDIIFINSNGVIVHIHPNAVPLDESAILSLTPAKAVLELRGGLAEELSINVGDKIQNLRQFGPVQTASPAQKPK